MLRAACWLLLQDLYSDRERGKVDRQSRADSEAIDVSEPVAAPPHPLPPAPSPPPRPHFDELGTPSADQSTSRGHLPGYAEVTKMEEAGDVSSSNSPLHLHHLATPSASTGGEGPIGGGWIGQEVDECFEEEEPSQAQTNWMLLQAGDTADASQALDMGNLAGAQKRASRDRHKAEEKKARRRGGETGMGDGKRGSVRTEWMKQEFQQLMFERDEALAATHRFLQHTKRMTLPGMMIESIRIMRHTDMEDAGPKWRQIAGRRDT